MSTVPRPRRPSPENDRFFYGWREVYRKDEHGRRVRTVEPLTRYDVLHPQEGDHIVQGDAHNDDCVYLKTVLKAHLRNRPEVQVFSDLGIVWDRADVPELENGNCPDVTVVVGARRRRDRQRFDVAAEGVRPELIIEITSPSTRDVDLRDKKRGFYRAGIPFYAIVDNQAARGRPRRLHLLGYRRGRRGWLRLPLNAQGRLWLETVGLWLGIEDQLVVCYDQNGEPLRDLLEETQARVAAEGARIAAEKRAAAEAQARAEMETKMREMEAELKRLRGE